LGEDHAQELVQARERLGPMISLISGNALVELFDRKMPDELREDGPSAVHVLASKEAKHGKTANRNSNRFRPSSAFEPYKMGTCCTLPKS
jgi:hypothetical protein